MNTTRTGLRGWRHWVALPALLLFSMAVYAQTPPNSAPCTKQEIAAKDPRCVEQLQEVVVTGSRIARPDFDRLQPTTVVSADTIDTRGFTDVGQALNQLPQFSVSPQSAANAQTGQGIAQSFVDLYGLGSQRTLVLVNGRRFVSGNTASTANSASNSLVGGPGTQVDLSVVPTKLIDHVETISVGGAPVYGADAIAGTVNIILKKNYTGVDVDAQAGDTSVHDAFNYRLRALAGQNFFDDRMNAIIVAEFTKADGLRGTSRQGIADAWYLLPPATPAAPGQCCANVLTKNGTFPSISNGGVPLVDDTFIAPAFGLTPAVAGITNSAGQMLAFGSGGHLVPYNLGTPTGNAFLWSGGDGYSLADSYNLLSPYKRLNIDSLLHFQINDSVEAFGEGWYSKTRGDSLGAQPAYNWGIFGPGGTAAGNFVVSVNNPFLSATDRGLIQTALNNSLLRTYPGTPAGVTPAYPAWNTSQFYISRSNIDIENVSATSTNTTWRGVLGLKGDFGVGERNYHWETSLNYGTSDVNQVTPSYVFQNLANALNATTNSSGQIVCAGNPVNAPVSTGSSTCAPLNIFGLGSPSPAALAYITHGATADSFNTQRDFNAFMSGDVLKLPGGDWKASAGFENRRESADFSPDSFLTGGYGQGTALGIEGSYRTNEVYLETLVPVFGPQQNIAALNRVELEGAVRRVNNSIAGDATTYTYGLRWAPIEDVLFRGNKTRSIRAPSITELFLPSITAYATAQDPCDKNYVNQGTAPATRAKNCAAAGIDTATFMSNVTTATVPGTNSGNPNLTSETAYSKTFGVVLRPRWVQNLNISVDYIDIALEGAISSLTLQDDMQACYDSTAYPNEPSCGTFTRNPTTHQVTNFHSGYVNAGLLEFTGIQAALDYTFALPRNWGNVRTGVMYLDTQRLTSTVGSASPIYLAGEIGNSKGKGNIDVRYMNRGFFWDTQAVFIGSAVWDTSAKPNTYDYPGLDRWWLINSTVGMQFTSHFGMQLIVNNVFDKQVQLQANQSVSNGYVATTSTYFQGFLGRNFLLSASYKF